LRHSKIGRSTGPAQKRATAAGYAPHSLDFNADHRVLLSAFGDSVIWVAAIIAALALLRLVDEASDEKLFDWNA
jgi:hypothetical protein